MSARTIRSLMALSAAVDDFKMNPDDEFMTWRIMASALLGLLGFAALYLGFDDLGDSGYGGKFFPYHWDIFVINLGAMAIAGALLVGWSKTAQPNKYVLAFFGLTLAIAGATAFMETIFCGGLDLWAMGVIAIGLISVVCSYRVFRRVRTAL